MQITTFLKTLSFKAKGTLVLAAALSLTFVYQNCSKTDFGSILDSSQSLGTLGTICSLDDVNSNSVSMSTTGFQSVGSNPTQFRSVPMGSFVFLWLNNYRDLEKADWFISVNGSAEKSLGTSDRLSYPNTPNSTEGITPGNYLIRINITKICDNLRNPDGTASQISKAAIANSSTLVKNLFVQFTVVDPRETSCPILDGLALTADDPKSIKTDITFNAGLPSAPGGVQSNLCNPQVEKFNFGDGVELKEPDAKPTVLHKYDHAGLYSASAKILLKDYPTRNRQMYKQIVVLSECPKIENMFLSGPALVYANKPNVYELQNFINGQCNLFVNKVIFKRDGQLVEEVKASPFKSSINWSSNQIKNSPEQNEILAEVYFNNPGGDGVNPVPFVIKKPVRVLSNSSICPADALASVFISGPLTALEGATLTHSINIPDCLKATNFTAPDDIDWHVLQPAFEGNTSDLNVNYNDKLSISHFYKMSGGYKLTAKIENTRVGTITISEIVYINSLASPTSNCNLGGQSVPHGSQIKAYETASVPYGQNCKFENRICSNGNLSGTYMNLKCDVATPLNCTLNGQSIAHGTSIKTYKSLTAAANENCESEDRMCANGVLSGSYTQLSCVKHCSFNGQNVNHGSKVTGYQAASVPFGQTCQSEERTCTNGTLSGNFMFGACSVSPAANCTFNGSVVPHGEKVTAYVGTTVPYGQSCTSQERQCVNGNLSGNYTAASCSVLPPASCNFNGQNVDHGTSVTAYESTSVASGQTCKSEQRTCTNGQLSGSFMNSSCKVNCLFNGQPVTHGAKVTAYQNASVPFGMTCSSEERTCSNGTLSGSFANAACSIQPAANCTFNGQPVLHGSNVTAYVSTAVPFGQSCDSQQRTCNNGNLSGTYTAATCSVTPPAGCTFNGQSVSHGSKVTAYQNSSVAYGQTCSSEERTCSNGNLSGSFMNATCSVQPAASCSFNGQTVANGSSVTAYEYATVPAGSSCLAQQRTCSNGTLSGNYMHSSCNVGCTFNGSPVSHGASITAFASSSVPFGQTCTSQSRTCSNGTLSGSYTASTCSVQGALNCNFNGQPVNHGSSVTAYQASSVPYGQTCASETRTCSNGNLSGSYTVANCSAQPPVNCSFNGQTVLHGANVTAYQSLSVAYGQTCTSQTRNCSNGTLSGSYSAATCSVQPAAGCSFNGQTIAHGATVTAYASSSVPFGQTCTSQVRTCNNGDLSGTYSATSCSVQTAANCSFNGQTVLHGSNVTAYASSSVSYGQSCSSQVRSCSNGTLSGTFPASTCSVQPPASCSFNGQTVSHGASVTAYLSSSVAAGSSCTSQQRTCSNGTLSGSYTHTSCVRGCSLGGTSVLHGQSITAYQYSSVSYGGSCSSQIRTCSDGTLSGTFSNLSCSVQPPANCSFNGQTVAHNSSVTAFASASVAYGQTCSSQTRTCSNGSLSGTYTHADCSVSPPANCTFNGSTVLHNASVTAYASASVAYGQSCSSQTRTCSNGTLSGNYSAASCFVQPGANCPSSPSQTTTPLCTVTRKCQSGVVLDSTQKYVNGVVTQAPITHGTDGPIMRSHLTFPSQYPPENVNWQTMRMYCDNGNYSRVTQDGFCTVTEIVPDSTDARCNPAPPDQSGWCAQAMCEYDGQMYNNSVSCCFITECGYGGFGTCRQRPDGTFYIEGLTCGRSEYRIQCK